MPTGLPSKRRFDLAAVQLQKIRLVGGVLLGLAFPSGTLAPALAKQLHKLARGDTIAVIGANIIVAAGWL